MPWPELAGKDHSPRAKHSPQDPETLLAEREAVHVDWLTMAEVTAQASAAVGPVIDTAATEWIRVLTWPGATVLVAYSPLGKSVAAWIQSKVAPALGTGSHSGQVPKEMAEAMREITTSMKRQTDVQTKQTEVLQQMQQGMAILLDRTPRQMIG